jgi:hypothetical protein
MQNKNTIILVLAVAFILLLPLLAMRFTNEVAWDLTDFVVAGTLLVGTALAYQLAARKGDNIEYRVAVGVSLAAALLLVSVNLAVGIIGAEDNPANLMYIGVLAVAVIGTVIARLQPNGMARILFATALAQALSPVIALIIGTFPVAPGVSSVWAANTFSVALWGGSALLFQRAARA